MSDTIRRASACYGVLTFDVRPANRDGTYMTHETYRTDKTVVITGVNSGFRFVAARPIAQSSNRLLSTCLTEHQNIDRAGDGLWMRVWALRGNWFQFSGRRVDSVGC